MTTKALHRREAIQQKTYVYVLDLSKDKFFVGTTPEQKDMITLRDIPKKYHDWLIKCRFKPMRPVMNKEIDHENVILYTVLDCMQWFGIKNVRGGPFDMKEMTVDQLRFIEKILDCTKKCDVCHQFGHCKFHCKSYDTGEQQEEADKEKAAGASASADNLSSSSSSSSSSSGFSSFFSSLMSSSSDSKDKDYRQEEDEEEQEEDDDDDDDDDGDEEDNRESDKSDQENNVSEDADEDCDYEEPEQNSHKRKHRGQ